MTSGCGGRKFFFPRTMKDPVGRYSPLGAVFDTCTCRRGRISHLCSPFCVCGCSCTDLMMVTNSQATDLLLPSYTSLQRRAPSWHY